VGATDVTTLSATRREAGGSRTARRLRRAGYVPGVVYGGTGEPVSVQVDALTLQRTLAHAGAVIELELEGDGGTPVLIKDTQRHPVTGAPLHIDFLRVRLDRPIQTQVVVELVGAEDSAGVREGGVLEQVTREITVEALPRDIPEHLTFDVSGMAVNDTATLAAVEAPAGVTLVDDPESVIATITPPRLAIEPEEEIETETELVGEAGGEGGEEAAAAEPGGEPRPETEQGTTPG
jgi:large subunit ribosomal protein L25